MSDEIKQVGPTNGEAPEQKQIPAITIAFDPDRMQVVNVMVDGWFRSKHMLLAVLRMAVDNVEAQLKMQMAIDRQREMDEAAKHAMAQAHKAQHEAESIRKNIHRG